MPSETKDSLCSIKKDNLSYFMCILFACTGSMKLVSGYFLFQSMPNLGIIFMIAGIFSYGMSVVYFLVYEDVI